MIMFLFFVFVSIFRNAVLHCYGQKLKCFGFHLVDKWVEFVILVIDVKLMVAIMMKCGKMMVAILHECWIGTIVWLLDVWKGLLIFIVTFDSISVLLSSCNLDTIQKVHYLCDVNGRLVTTFEDPF